MALRHPLQLGVDVRRPIAYDDWPERHARGDLGEAPAGLLGGGSDQPQLAAHTVGRAEPVPPDGLAAGDTPRVVTVRADPAGPARPPPRLRFGGRVAQL